jgi:hypothetical protein
VSAVGPALGSVSADSATTEPEDGARVGVVSPPTCTEVPSSPPLPPVPALLGEGAAALVGGFGGTTEVLADGVADADADGVVDAGRVVVEAGAGVFVGLAEGVFGGIGGGGLGATIRRSPGTGRSRGSDSLMNRVFGGVLTVGSGVGLGRVWLGSTSWSGRSGSDRIAVALTGPPARLTLISPP